MIFKLVCNKCGYTILVDKKLEDLERIPHDMRCPHCGATLDEFKLLHEEESTPLT